MARNLVAACVCACFLWSAVGLFAADPSDLASNGRSAHPARLGGVVDFPGLRLPYAQIDRGEQIMVLEGLMGLRPTPAGSPFPAQAGGQVRPRMLRMDAMGRIVEVPIGAEAGIRGDHELDVYRDGKYLGRVKLIDLKNIRDLDSVLEAYRKANF